MSNLIDRAAVRDALYEADAITMRGVKMLNEFPGVELVRCRDCKWAVTAFGDSGVEDASWLTCKNLHGNPIMRDTSFCSYGERRVDHEA